MVGLSDAFICALRLGSLIARVELLSASSFSSCLDASMLLVYSVSSCAFFLKILMLLSRTIYLSSASIDESVPVVPSFPFNADLMVSDRSVASFSVIFVKCL